MTDSVYDFSRSFLQFTTDHTQHTPRVQLEASCEISGPGESAEFFLTADCMSEKMYAPSGLVHQPPSLFSMIASRDGRFLMEKRHADAARDIQETHRVGEVMSTHDGKGATVLKLEIDARSGRNPRPLSRYAEIREAILANRPMVGRTTYRTADGARQVRLVFPIKTCNIANGREGWQIDTGSMILPDPAATGPISLTSLRRAYMLFNAPTWAEFALRAGVPLGPGGGSTTHYSVAARLENLTNELFSIE